MITIALFAFLKHITEKLCSKEILLLVGFGLVQPYTTYEGARHTSNDNGQTNSPSIHLFTLKEEKCWQL